MDNGTPYPASIDQLIADFELLDDWEDRYRYVIELGKALPPLPEAERTEANKVRGCASQVWLWTRNNLGDPARLRFVGDSDAHIVRGLIAVLIALFDNRTAAEIDAIDAEARLAELDLAEHLSSQRSNGVRAMVERIRTVAAEAA